MDLEELKDLGPLNELGFAEGMTAEHARFLANALRADAPEKAEQLDAYALRLEGRLN